MTIDDNPEQDEPQPGSTAYLLQEMQLYGHRPFEDEPDHRPLPDARAASGAIADIFDALVSALIDTRIEPDLEDLAWGVVNVFQRAGERIERELDGNEQAQKRLQREQDGSEVKSARSEGLPTAAAWAHNARLKRWRMSATLDSTQLIQRCGASEIEARSRATAIH